MARPKADQSDPVEPKETQTLSIDALAEAIARASTVAIEAAKPVGKKTIETRVKKTPWTPPEGIQRLKLKRKVYQHSLPISEKFLSNEEISLFNQLRPGTYLDNWVKVVRRRDKGINIDYNIKTSQQRLKLPTQFGVRNLVEVLRKCVDEAKNPKPEVVEDFD